ncbi:ATP-binding protein [Marivibrio halodurans]|uniref:ATP-binding protein n=1 Tax=Marivibrio halodurans TaxID=2039722 RepID=A0A8J7S044_9PROT|nr:AAA family ATPase [Marivibrio halodurans]MBP5857840.1 ATP-binding protein [Marivibrio halodurans]
MIDKIERPKTPEDWLALEFDIAQLFSTGPVDEERLFAGRTSQVRLLLETVFDRSKHAILFGERGVGKSSLANIFWRRYGKTLQSFVIGRVQTDPSDDFTSLWTKALEELLAFAKMTGRAELVPIEVEFDRVSPDTIRRELQKCNPNSIPIIIIDEFDKLYDEDAKELTANLIKSLSDYNVTATIILVGVAENVSDLVKGHESIRRPLVQVKLDRMSNEELNEILNLRLKLTPLKLDGDARWKIVTLARGLPFYVHMLGKYSFQNAARERRLTVKDGDVDAAMDRFISETEQSFQDDYVTATASNQTDAKFQEVLLACALAQSDDAGFFSPTSVIPPLKMIRKRPVTHANFQRHLTEFVSEDRGRVLIRRGQDRQFRYRFRDPMMQPYIIIKGIRDEMVDESTRNALSYPEAPLLPLSDPTSNDE